MYVIYNMYMHLQIHIHTHYIHYLYTHTHTHIPLYRDQEKNVTFICCKESQRVQNPGFVVSTNPQKDIIFNITK